jgi:Uma2 family endonuclease
MNAPLVYPKLTAAELVARWRALVAQAGLPERWELDEYGELIEMNPPSTPHQRIVYSVQKQLESQLGGEPVAGIGVITPIGVRIPDVTWQKHWTNVDPVSPAPTICVEVQSPENTRREISEKTAAYLEAGAEEVILVELSGRIRYFGTEGERAASIFNLKLALPPNTYPL